MATTSNKRSHRTLGSLLKYFEDMPLRIELKNGRIFRGTLDNAETNMSLTLRDAVQMTPPQRGTIQKKSSASASSQEDEKEKAYNAPILPLLQIRGSTVRYIHFPDQVDLAGVIQAGIHREKQARDKYKRGVRKAPKRPP